VAAAANQRSEELKEYTQKIAIVRGGYLASEPDNARDHTAFVTLVVSSGWVLEVLGIMIAGMGFYRIGFLSASLPSRVYLGTALAGYSVAISIVLIGLEHSRLREGSWVFRPRSK